MQQRSIFFHSIFLFFCIIIAQRVKLSVSNTLNFCSLSLFIYGRKKKLYVGVKKIYEKKKELIDAKKKSFK